MMFHLLRALPALVLSLLTLSFSGCAAVGQMLPGPVGDLLGQVSQFTGGISNWQSGLGEMLDGTQLGQLKEYADRAGELGGSISGMTEGLTEAMADPLGAIGSKLTSMSGIDIDQIKDLAPAAQMDRVREFADAATSVGSETKSVMKQFGK